MSKSLEVELVSVAHRLADVARTETLKYFRSAELGIESKRDDFDPVTLADRAAEEAMRALLADTRPDDAVLGEEFGSATGTSGFTWILDPIDGTRGFMSGTPTWGVLVAVADDAGKPLFGVIEQPYIGERFVGGFGNAYLDGPRGTTQLRTRGTQGLSDATLLSTFPEIGTDAERAMFEGVARNVRLVRYGMDCYGYALLALGQVDLVIEAGLEPFDIAAPLAVVEAAGGVVTDWSGGPAHGGGRVLAAANRAIHAEALARISAD